MLQALCWVRQWKRREWLEGTAGQPSLSGFYISGISSVFQSSQLGVCLSVSPIDPPCLSCLAYVKECWTFYQKEFTNVLCSKLLIYTADFLGLSFPISQRRGWPHEMKRLPPLWCLVIFRNEETTLGFFMELSWHGSAGKSRLALHILHRSVLRAQREAHVQTPLSTSSQTPLSSDSLSFPSLWGWLCCAEELTFRCWKDAEQAVWGSECHIVGGGAGGVWVVLIGTTC